MTNVTSQRTHPYLLHSLYLCHFIACLSYYNILYYLNISNQGKKKINYQIKTLLSFTLHQRKEEKNYWRGRRSVVYMSFFFLDMSNLYSFVISNCIKLNILEFMRILIYLSYFDCHILYKTLICAKFILLRIRLLILSLISFLNEFLSKEINLLNSIKQR